jgi:DNA-binding MarR family transcriptional regulator
MRQLRDIVRPKSLQWSNRVYYAYERRWLLVATRNKVQKAQFAAQIRDLHGSILDIIVVINRPERDELLIKAAAIPLDRALFPLLVVIDKFGPVGVGDLADRVGRDYTTVSRQVARLASLRLVERRAGAKDRRVTETAIAPKGKVMIAALDTARERLGRRIFKSWDPGEVDELIRLMRKFAEDIKEPP